MRLYHRALTEFEQTLYMPNYVPRPRRSAPGTAILDAPSYYTRINADWLPHILGVITALDQPDAWQGTEAEIDDARNQIREFIDSLKRVYMLPIGTKLDFAGKLADLPDWCLPCDGTTYDRVDYPELYAALDDVFILDADTFQTPDTQERVIVGLGGSYSMGDTFGENAHALTEAENAQHHHTYYSPTYNVDVESVGVPDPTGVGLPKLPENTSNSGSGQAHENRQPSLVLRHYIIARYP